MEQSQQTHVGPHVVEVTGGLGDVRFPNLCVSCGDARPAGDVAVEKLFRRVSSDHPTTYHLATVRVPLCGGCLTAHAAEERPVDEAALRALRRQWAIKVLPYVLPIAIQLWFVFELGPKALRALPGLLATPRDWSGALWLVPVAFFAAMFVLFVWMAVRAGRPLIATGWPGDPNATYARTAAGALGSLYVVPTAPTRPLAAVDYGDEQFELFAPNRRAFTFAHAGVAEQFAALNAERVWDPASPRAARARRATTALVVLLIAAALAMFVYQMVVS